MTNKTLLTCAAVVGASLYFLYALSVFQFLQHLDLSSINLVELVIVITQALRLVGVAAYYRGRPARADVLLILVSFETFVVTGLIALYLTSTDPFYSQLANTIFSTWVAALFTILPSYLIFAGVAQMVRSRRLVVVLLPIALELGFLVFIAASVAEFRGTLTFAGFFDFLVAVTTSKTPTTTISALTALSILVTSVAAYCSLLVYSTIPTATSVVQPKVTFILPLLSAAVSLGWVYAAVLMLPNSLLSFTVPGIILVALLWGYMRR
ncbi:MAG TPA: hypothetical protein VND41_05710 [Nitrososphaerales archaeon]|nr:hypothetical protein [Nitrososphaerales archaeon]